MKVALVDDKPEELKRILDIMKRSLPQAKVYTFSCGETFLESWNDGEYDLILLDIFMDKILGVDVARKVRETDSDVRIVFCTTSNEFACESYEIGVNYYLQKPISDASFNKMLEMIRLSQYEMNRFIRLPDGQRVVLRDVIYSEYHNHVITIHVKRGTRLQTRMSQMEWERILSDHTFFYSCSKGLIVNFYEIENQEDGLFFMSNGTTVPISRRKSKETIDAFAKFRFEKMRKENL